MRRVLLIAGLAGALVACGGDDDDDDLGDCTDDGGAACFLLPTAAMSVTPEGGSAQPANLNCPPASPDTSAFDVTVAGEIVDYSNQHTVSGATVEIYFADIAGTPDVSATSDAAGAYSFVIPSGSPSLFNARTYPAEGEGTYAYVWQGSFDVSEATIDYDAAVLLDSTVDALLSPVRLYRDSSFGYVAFVAHDCDDEAIEHVIGTLSTTSSKDGSAPTHVDAIKVFYGAGGSYPIPLNRAVREESNDDGTVWLFEVPPTGSGQTYYAQIWGFLDADDLALGADGLTLVAEYELPVYADCGNTAFMRPSEGPVSK